MKDWDYVFLELTDEVTGTWCFLCGKMVYDSLYSFNGLRFSVSSWIRNESMSISSTYSEYWYNAADTLWLPFLYDVSFSFLMVTVPSVSWSVLLEVSQHCILLSKKHVWLCWYSLLCGFSSFLISTLFSISFFLLPLGYLLVLCLISKLILSFYSIFQ